MVKTKITYIIIYIIGFIVSYIIVRREKRHEFGKGYSWANVCQCILASLFSWFLVACWIIIQLVIIISKIEIKNPKPPKFL